MAILDTGINYNHQDLRENLWTNDAELFGQKGVDDDGNGYIDDIYGVNTFSNNGNPFDGHSHGSHCAGGVLVPHIILKELLE